MKTVPKFLSPACLSDTASDKDRRFGFARGVLFGPDAVIAVASGCPALLAWDLRCCQLTRSQMEQVMRMRPRVAMMSSGRPALLASERSFVLFEGDEVPPSRMTPRMRLEARVSAPAHPCSVYGVEMHICCTSASTLARVEADAARAHARYFGQQQFGC